MFQRGNMNKLTIDDLSKSGDLTGRKVLVRVDFNVPMSRDESGKIADDKRIRESLPTIKKILGDGGTCILMSHLGRPKGERDEKYSLRPVARHLAVLLDRPVYFADDCIGLDTHDMVNELKRGDILLLENLRFHKEEEANADNFSKELASFGDIYVNDAFGSAHRAHASTVGVTKYVSKSAAGYLMQKELEFLSKVISNPERPLTAVLGGSKISGKIDVIKNLLGKADKILIGGGMMFTFYRAKGIETGKSLIEEDRIEMAKQIVEEGGDKIVLPVDVVVCDKFEKDSRFETVDSDKIPVDKIGMDIGEKTIELFRAAILGSKTIVWNGPMGVFEMENFAKGTMGIARALAEATSRGAVTVIGGGDTAAAVSRAHLEKAVSHVSTGGGASLEFLEGKMLPGVAALSNK